MMSILISVFGFAALFALFGALQRSRPKCSSNCGACTNACDATHTQDDL
ncbi:hypothetical protein BH23GEM9_BH23GEM9_33820 [soil metagenome]